MKKYTFTIGGKSQTPDTTFTIEEAEYFAKALIAAEKGDCRFHPVGEEDSARTFHYMVDCPTCNGKGKTGNPAWGPENMKICTKCEGKKKVEAYRLNPSSDAVGNS
jgi:hypothetical protein